MGWLIALGVLAVLAIVPLGIKAQYNAEGFTADLITGPVRIRLFPVAKREKGSSETQRASQKPAKPANAAKGGSITDFIPLLQTALELLNDFRKKLRIDVLQLKLILGSDDPCDLSLNYGRGWAVLGNLMPLLECAFTIKKRNLEVECDYTSDITTVLARADLTITLGRLLVLLIRYGPRAFKQYYAIMNKRKGGANT